MFLQTAEMGLREKINKKDYFLMRLWSIESVPDLSLPPCMFLPKSNPADHKATIPRDTVPFHVCRKEVILSGGVVGSPQLLLLSGVGPAEHLEEVGVPLVHHLPGVGQNFQDHSATLG